jgi:hypothetical protein
MFEIVIYDPYAWMFNLGLSLNRYVEQDRTHKWVRKEFEIGLFFLSLRFNFIFNKEKRED